MVSEGRIDMRGSDGVKTKREPTERSERYRASDRRSALYIDIFLVLRNLANIVIKKEIKH